MQHKSVITCDLEGRIRTFNEGAQELFGFCPEEVVGRKRVQAFSPGLVVLEHLPKWLEAARSQGESRARTVFLRKDGTPFAAEIRITPTRKDGQHDGYCGVTEPLPGVDPRDAMPPISTATRVFSWLAIARAPFLTATLVPIAVAAGWVAWRGLAKPFPWGLLALVAVAGSLLQVAANVFNDYFDWKSGTDQANADYFMPFSGGSRAIELGLVTPRGMLAIGWVSVAVSLALAGWLIWLRGPGILWFGLAGVAAAWFYTAPPLRLVARRGLGELTLALCFGPLMVAGAAFALSGHFGLDSLLAGVPTGLLTLAILWVNQIPDAPSDATTGKNNLVVTLGPRRASIGHGVLLAVALVSFGALVAAGIYPGWTLLAWLATPLAAYASTVAVRHYQDRSLVRANRATIQLQLAAGILTVVGLLLAR